MKERTLKRLVVLLLLAQLGSAALVLHYRRRANVLDEFARVTYAQQGEDLIIANLFEHLGLRVETYLDLGAWDPVRDSNTYLFYRRGARGVLVEPNPHYVERLRRERPGDTVLAVGVGTAAAEAAPYFVVDDGRSGWNTFSAAQAEAIRATGRSVREVALPLVPVDRILQEHFAERPPDLLSIDVEGHDLAILRTLDFARFRPRVICVETKALTSHERMDELVAFVVSQGYELRGATFVNSIFVDAALLRGGKAAPGGR